MTISERDQRVLRELEESLRSPSNRGSFAGFAAVATGLVLIVVGLVVLGAIGTCVSVVGSLVLVAGAWRSVDNGRVRRRLWESSRQEPPKP